MIREDNWDGRQRSDGSWRRRDIGIDYPFPQVFPGDKEIFKRVQTDTGLTVLNVVGQISWCVGGQAANTDGTGTSLLGD